MKCAFKVKLPQQYVDPAIDSEEEIDNLDDEELWEDVDIMQETLLGITSSRQKLSCSLQLVIGDGLKEAKFISLAIAKASKLTSLPHSSTTFKSRFEAAFGNKSLPVANVTRWNSTFKQVQAITGLDYKILAEVCVKDFENVMFTLHEWNQFQELSAVLGPFLEATDLTQGEKYNSLVLIQRLMFGE
ncbi:zinc finger BED domain-containing protein 4-like [Tachysurus ichikawai]